MRSYESPKKSIRSLSVSSGLQEYIDHMAILVNSSPQVVQLAINLHEDLINKVKYLRTPCVCASDAERTWDQTCCTTNGSIHDLP